MNLKVIVLTEISQAKKKTSTYHVIPLHKTRKYKLIKSDKGRSVTA